MIKRADFIIPECYVDTNLVETLVCPAGCNHQKGCNQVAKVMQEKFSNRFAIGMIDADKRRPSYLNEFKAIASSTHISLFRHPKRPHFIILVQPAIEGFILSCASIGNIDLKEYDLSPDMKHLTTQTKNVISNKDQRFKRLFKSMENYGEVKLLKTLIAYLIDNTYNSIDAEIISIFNSN